LFISFVYAESLIRFYGMHFWFAKFAWLDPRQARPLHHSHTCYTRQPVMQWLSVCCVFVSLFDRFLWVSLFKFIWSLLAELECLIIDLFTCLFLFVGIQSFVRQVWLGRYSSGKAACVS
jgi:hypothetical protein